MKSPLRLSNRLSNFRFSLASVGPLRSPVSPLTPPHHLQDLEPLPSYHTSYHASSSTRTSTAPTIVAAEPHNEKVPGIAVTTREPSTNNHIVNQTLELPTALPTPTDTKFATTDVNQHYYHQPTHSPITPWHATFHRNAASTDQETNYLTQTLHLRRARTTISVILLLLSATTTALTSAILHGHLSTKLPSSFSLPLWPTDLNLTPTLLTLTTSVLTLLLTLPTTILHLIHFPNPRVTLCNALFTTLSLSTTILSLSTLTTSTIQSPLPLFSTFISKTLTSLVITTGPKSTTGLTPNGIGSNPHPETIQSFTCALSNTATKFSRDAQALSLPYPEVSAMVPAGFPRLCLETKVDMSLVILLCLVGAAGIVVGLWSWGVERRIEMLRGEREVLASREGACTAGEEGVDAGRVVKMPAFVEKEDLEVGVEGRKVC